MKSRRTAGFTAIELIFVIGTRDLCINGQPAYRLVQTTNWSAITWGATIHKQQGNIGLADGSAHQTTDLLLQKALLSSGVTTNRFAIP